MKISSNTHIYMDRNEVFAVHVPFPAKSKRKPLGGVRIEISTFNGEESIDVVSDLFWRRFVITGKGKLKEVKAHPSTHE